MFGDIYKAHALEKQLEKGARRRTSFRTDASLLGIAQALQQLPTSKAPYAHHRRLYLNTANMYAPRSTNLLNWAAYLSGATLALGIILTGVLTVYARPGSTLYAYKHTGQVIRLKLENNANARANLQLRYAVTRLHETESVLSDSTAGIDEKAAALTDLASQTENIVATVKEVAVAQNDSELLSKLEDLTSKQSEVLATPTDPLIKAAAEGAIKATEASTKTIAEAKRLVAAASESSITALPVTVSGTISKVNEKDILIGTDTVKITEDTLVLVDKQISGKMALKTGQPVVILAVEQDSVLTAEKITITPDPKQKPTENNGKHPTEELENEIPDKATSEAITVQSGFMVEDPTPQFPEN